MHLDATVSDDLRRIEGTLRVEDAPPGWTWVDPLATLEDPPHELDRLRTFPEQPNRGHVRRSRDGDTWTFTAELPRRYGDVGYTSRSLFANGAWYPQPLDDGALPQVDWEVVVRLPPDSMGALGDQVGAGELRWSGHAERASLAVVPGGVRTDIETAGWSVAVLSRGPLGKLFRTKLREQLLIAEVDGQHRTAALVRAPLRRRLARSGPGLVYASDRTWAVFPLFYRLHHSAPIRELYAASSDHHDPFDRELEAASLSVEHVRRYLRRQSVDLLGLTQWLSIVDAALYDREMAFQHELFRSAHPTDRVRDDLVERFGGGTAGTVVLAQLGDKFGEEAALSLGQHLARGWSLDEAATLSGVDPDWLDRWHRPYPTQDYRLSLRGSTVEIVRDAPEDALPEFVVVRVDGETYTWETPEGPATHEIARERRPRRAKLDPEGHLGQTTRVGELRPAPLRWTLGGAITGVNISEAFATAYAALTIRRADDTLNRWLIYANTNQRDRLRLRLSYTRFAGPLRRGATREHALSISAEGSWLNPNFAQLEGAPLSVGGSLAYSWDNRVYSLFPTEGTRISGAVSAGGVPATGDSYVTVSGTFIGLAAPSPRHVFAGKISGGASWTDIPQRRLRFGGSFGIRGIPDEVVQTELQAIVSAEYRVALLREANIPLFWLTWVRELQLVAGVDMGTGRSDGDPIAAVGVNAGVGVIADNLGLSPGGVNLTVGVPLWLRGFEMPDRAVPFELYLTWGQMF